MKPDNCGDHLRILLIDDSKHDRIAFREALSDSDFEITECVRAEEGLEALDNKVDAFDIVVSDHGLPGISGLEFLKKLLADKTPLPLLLLTGSGSEHIAVEALRAGVDDYMVKDPAGGYLHLLPAALPAVRQNYVNHAAKKRAEAALGDSEQKYRLLFSNMLDGFALHEIVVDENNVPVDYWFLDINDAFETLTGLKRDNIIGRKVTEALPGIENDPAGWIEKYGEVAQTGKEIRFEQYAQPLDKWFSVHAYRPSKNQFAVIFTDVTEQRKAEQKIKSLSLFPSENPNPVMRFSSDGEILYHNDASQRILEQVGRKLGDSAPEGWLGYIEDCCKSNTIVTFEYDAGEQIYSILLSPTSEAGRLHFYGRDITDRKKAEEKMKLASKVFESIVEGVVVTDPDTVIEYVNPAFTKITGYTASEAIGEKPRLIKSGLHDKAFYEGMWESLLTNGSWEGEIWNRRKNGEPYPEWLTISAIRNDEGKTTQYASVFYDITELKQGQEEIKYQAYHDALTGLPNRLLFNDRLVRALGHANRNNNQLAVLFIDLDNFKNINDSLGHEAGDLLLKGVTARLVSSLREEDTVARFGGDEFTIILENFDEAEDTSLVAQKIIEELSEPFLYKDSKLFITTSIGITIYPDDGESVEKLLKNADMAMYRAKEQGKNRYQFFTREMNIKAVERFRIEDSLRKAIENEEFLVHYQPKVDLKTGLIVSMEALVRWQKPTGELVPPADFIPISEETGLIIPIGEWVLRTACLKARGWIDKGYGPLKVTVNLSAKQFRDEDLVKCVKMILDETGLRPEHLELELTESAMMTNIEQNISTMECLSSMGIKLAIDDFGTGYSSLSYLRRFPINTLKIDRSFVSEVPGNRDAESIVEVIIAMARSLGLSVVAEGVETREQLRFLRKRDCNEMQGFYFSKPLPEEEFEALVKKGERLECVEEIE